MRSRKQWIISGAVAALLATGGLSVLSGSQPAPLTHEEILKRSEDKFGKAPSMPTVESLKDQLAQVEATAPATTQTTTPDDPQKPRGDAGKVESDWEKAELLKQQIVFAEHAPSPMPTGHSSYVVSGKKP